MGVKPVEIRLPYEPRRHQREAHSRRKRFSVLVWHRRAGKTVFAVMELVLAALESKRERARYGYIGPLLNQTRRGVWDYLLHYLGPIPGVKFNASEMSATLPNGARISLFGADNPDALRNLYFDGVVLDEVAQMRPEVWGEIVRPELTDRQGWALFIGTPKGTNLFSETYYRALNLPDEWYTDLRRWTDTDALEPAEVEKARSEMSAAEFRQEFECDFGAASVDSLIALDDVLESQRRAVKRADYECSAKTLGVDVARYGGDRSVVICRQGLLCEEPRVFRDIDTMALAGQVALIADEKKPDAIFIDMGAMGAGVYDRLSQLGYACIGIDFGSKPISPRYENKRAEMWVLMRDWVKEGGCLPPACRELTAELVSPAYTYANARGRMQLESKDDMRARGLPSPDVADALALTFAMPVAPRLATAGVVNPYGDRSYFKDADAISFSD